MKNEENWFPKNMQRWAQMCSVGESRVSKMVSDGVSSLVSFCLTDSGTPNLQRAGANGVEYIHSQSDPIAEAREWFSSLHTKQVEVIYIYGIGLGYYYEAAREWLRGDLNRFVVFLEEDPQVMRCLLQTERCHEILYDGQVFVHLLEEGQRSIAQLNEIVKLFANKKMLLSALSSELKLHSREYQEFWSKISFIDAMNRLWLSELHAHGATFFRNSFANYLDLPQSYLGDRLFGQFKGIPAIICGAGPSLDKNIDLLATLSDRALIFAGGTALNALTSKNILPHFGVGIDPNPPQFTRLVMNEAYETPFFYRMRMYHEALSVVHGDKMYVSGSAGYAITNWMEKRLGIKEENVTGDQEIAEGYNVLNFSLALAQALGCNPIICVGIDLAYSPEGASYAGGIQSHPLHDRKEDFRTRNLAEEVVSKKNIYGQPVFTLWKWIAESSWYSQFADLHPGIKLINATEGGIGFISVENMSLAEVAKTYLAKQYDLAALVHGEIQQGQFSESVNIGRIKQLFRELKDSLLRSTEKYKHIISLLLEEVKLNGEEIVDKGSQSEIEIILEELRSEESYKAILQKFEEGHQAYIALPLKQIELIEGLSEKEMRQRKALLQIAYFNLFVETALTSAALIENSLAEKCLQSAPVAANPPPGVSSAERNLAPTTQKTQSEYKEGILHGRSLVFSDVGDLLAETLFVDGYREGEAKRYYLGGALHSTQRFHNGVRHGDQEYFYRDGTMKSRIPYKNGKLHGKVILFYPNNKPFRELNFVSGVREGVEQLWEQSGLLILEANYTAGKPVGVTRSWYSNGKLAREILYDSQSQRLEERQWDLQGNLIVKDKGVQGDFFDVVNAQSQKLTKSLDDSVNTLVSLMPAFVEKMSDSPAADLLKQVGDMKKEMERLKGLESMIVNQLEKDEAGMIEDVWKNPRTKQSIEKYLEVINQHMGTDMKTIEEGLAKIIKELKSRLTP